MTTGHQCRGEAGSRGEPDTKLLPAFLAAQHSPGCAPGGSTWDPMKREEKPPGGACRAGMGSVEAAESPSSRSFHDS